VSRTRERVATGAKFMATAADVAVVCQRLSIVIARYESRATRIFLEHLTFSYEKRSVTLADHDNDDDDENSRQFLAN
jgi:transposase